jgi:cell division protein FtsZ
MKGAKGVIISITGGEDMRLMEVDEAASHIKELVDPDANIIWGSAFNNDLGGKLRVSVVATGIEAETVVQAQPGKVFTFPASRTTPAAPATPAPPAAEIKEDTVTLDLTADDDSDELLLDSDDILTSPVSGAPIAPPIDDDMMDEGDDLTGDLTGSEPETPKLPRESGTLFERMSNIARGAAKAQAEDEEAPGFRQEPIDIPRFLNRQNNQ